MGAEEGRRWELHGKRAAAGALCRGDGLPAVIERGGQVWEGHWETVVVLGYLVWGRRGWWRGAPWWPWAAAAMAHGELRGKQREGVAAPCVSLGMRRRTSWARVCCLGKGYAAKESDGEATVVDDGAGSVARHQASGTRVA